MAGYTTMFSSGRVHNQIKEYVVDTYSVVTQIDISQILPGSRVFVIKDETHDNKSQWYMLNHSGGWDPISWGSGGGGSTEDVIYDGGGVEQNSEENTSYDGGET